MMTMIVITSMVWMSAGFGYMGETDCIGKSLEFAHSRDLCFFLEACALWIYELIQRPRTAGRLPRNHPVPGVTLQAQ